MSDTLTIQSHKGPYDVLFGDDARSGLAALAAGDRPLHVIVDERVAALHGDRLAPLLAGPSVLRLEATETNKSLEKFPAYVDHLVGKGIRRDHLLVAIGGARSIRHRPKISSAPSPRPGRSISTWRSRTRSTRAMYAPASARY